MSTHKPQKMPLPHATNEQDSGKEDRDNAQHRQAQGFDTRLILASGSPYRKILLQQLQLPFSVIVPGIDETARPGETATELALRLAEEKARHVGRQHPEALVIGSDQVVLFDGELMGKPGNHTAARRQLQRFSGQTVHFHTAVCLCRHNKLQLAHVPTECKFRQLSDTQIEHYLRAAQPYDTAGSAKIEGLGIALMEKVLSDDPTALVGLPLIALSQMLRTWGLDPLLRATAETALP